MRKCIAEGDDWDELLTNDEKKVFFKQRFLLDSHLEYEYYDTIEDISKRLSDYVGHYIRPSRDEVYHEIDKWECNNYDTEKYIILKEYRVIKL